MRAREEGENEPLEKAAQARAQGHSPRCAGPDEEAIGRKGGGREKEIRRKRRFHPYTLADYFYYNTKNIKIII